MLKPIFQTFSLVIFLFCSLSFSFSQSRSFEIVDIFTMADGLSSNDITCLNKYDNSLLAIGTQNGLHLYDGYDFQLFNHKTPPPFTLNNAHINSMEIDKEGYFWIGSNNGINKVDPFEGKNYLFFNKTNLKYPPLKTDTFSNTLLTSTLNGTIWIVNNGIICRIKDSKVRQYFPEKYNDVTKILSNENNNILAFTKQSLVCLDAAGHLVFEIKEFISPLHGLQQMNEMSNLFKTKDGEVIIEDSLNGHYFRISPSGQIDDITIENHWLVSLFDVLDQHAQLHKINNFRKYDFLETTDGLIWVATNIGLIKVKVDAPILQEQNKTITHFVSSYMKYNATTGELNSYFLNPNKTIPIQLSSEEIYLEIHFINSDYTNPSKNTFSHYLEGFEKNWLPYSNKNSVSYSNLPAGEYTFKLKSTRANGIESDFVLEFPILVKQSFYKNWWFMGLVIVSVLSGIIMFNWLKLKQERKITQIRNRMASDLHDEVSNSLNNIRIIAKETNYSDKEEMYTSFHLIQKMSSEAIEHVEDAIWAIDKSYSTAEDLFFKMEDYIDDVLRAKKIPVEFRIEGLNKNAFLGFLYRRNMLLIFKEAISNIVKHTKPTKVTILYKKDIEGYFMEISNFFEERIEAEYSTGKGLIGMRQRAEAMGATMSFIQEKNRFVVRMEKKFKKK